MQYRDMTYQGLTYSSALHKVYETRFPNALTSISSHSRPTVNRIEEQTLVDPFMLEAFEADPFGYDRENLAGYSRSYYTRTAHLESILAMQASKRFPKPTDHAMKTVDNYCFNYFARLPKVQSLNLCTDLDQVPFEPTSSAGYLFPGKKGDPGNLERAIRQARAIIGSIERENSYTIAINESVPDLAFTRTQLTQLTSGLKVRNVFGQHFTYILLEGLTAYPLMELFKNGDYFFFVGEDPRIGVPDLLTKYMSKRKKLMAIDWSKFDTTVEPWEIEDSFDLLESILTFPNNDSLRAFEFSKILFINRKVASPDGRVYFKQRGIPSGSYYTMLIDSIVNWRRILYLHFRAYDKLPISVTTQGDDGITVVEEHVTPHGLALAIPNRAPWILNPEKCASGTSPSTVPFLQRTLKFCSFARDVKKVERLAIYPEYEVPNGQISTFRAKSLLEDCNYESSTLRHAYSYLLTKYGEPTVVEDKWKLYWQVLFKN